jgi:hypothetical protein
MNLIINVMNKSKKKGDFIEVLRELFYLAHIHPFGSVWKRYWNLYEIRGDFWSFVKSLFKRNNSEKYLESFIESSTSFLREIRRYYKKGEMGRQMFGDFEDPIRLPLDKEHPEWHIIVLNNYASFEKGKEVWSLWKRYRHKIFLKDDEENHIIILIFDKKEGEIIGTSYFVDDQYYRTYEMLEDHIFKYVKKCFRMEIPEENVIIITSKKRKYDLKSHMK